MISSVGYVNVLVDRQKTHLHILQSLVSVLGLLAEEIRYERFYLSEIFLKLSAKYHGPTGKVMGQIADRLKEQHGANAENVWETVFLEHQEILMLTEEELDILIDVGKTLGYLDAKTQIGQIEICIRRLQAIHDRAEQELRNKRKVFCYMGVSCGLMVILILL